MAIFLIILIDESQRPYLLGPMKRDSRESACVAGFIAVAICVGSTPRHPKGWRGVIAIDCR
jgi:hypothetical protein